MKKFKLKVEQGEFEVTGKSLDDIEGWEEGKPALWAENLDKVTEEDITQDMQLIEDKRARRIKVEAFLDANFETLEAMVAAHGK